MENLFTSLSHPDSIMFLISVLLCFLLGFLTGWALWGSKAKRYRRDAEKWKKSFDELTIEHRALREQFDLKEADLVKAQREAEEANEQLHAFFQDKAQWQADLDAAMSDTVKMQANISSYKALAEDLQNQILGLKARNSQLTKDAEKEGTALDQVSHMQSSFNATLTRINSLEEKISQLITENESLRKDSGGEERIAALESKLAALESENSAPEIVAEKSPILHKDKDVISIIVTPSAAKDSVLSDIGSKIPAAGKDEKDDLTMIKGIGSFIEKKLNGLGIYTFEQVSKFDHDFIEKITAAIEFFPGRIERDDWVGQASRLASIKQENPDALATKAVYPNNPEDLKIIEGIGPKIEKLLNEAGIHNWEKLAETPVEEIRDILQQAGERYRIHDPETWPEQARMAAGGEFEKLKEYQQQLTAGKNPE